MSSEIIVRMNEKSAMNGCMLLTCTKSLFAALLRGRNGWAPSMRPRYSCLRRMLSRNMMLTYAKSLYAALLRDRKYMNADLIRRTNDSYCFVDRNRWSDINRDVPAYIPSIRIDSFSLDECDSFTILTYIVMSPHIFSRWSIRFRFVSRKYRSLTSLRTRRTTRWWSWRKASFISWLTAKYRRESGLITVR
jgi:hypothetical protein